MSSPAVDPQLSDEAERQRKADKKTRKAEKRAREVAQAAEAAREEPNSKKEKREKKEEKPAEEPQASPVAPSNLDEAAETLRKEEQQKHKAEQKARDAAEAATGASSSRSLRAEDEGGEDESGSEARASHKSGWLDTSRAHMSTLASCPSVPSVAATNLKFEFRPATNEQVQQALQEWNQPISSERMLSDEMTPEYRTVHVTQQSGVLAILGMTVRPEYLWISNLQVHPNHRRQGLGTQIVEGFIRPHARSNKVNRIGFATINSNRAAQEFWARFDPQELRREAVQTYWAIEA